MVSEYSSTSNNLIVLAQMVVTCRQRMCQNFCSYHLCVLIFDPRPLPRSRLYHATAFRVNFWSQKARASVSLVLPVKRTTRQNLKPLYHVKVLGLPTTQCKHIRQVQCKSTDEPSCLRVSAVSCVCLPVTLRHCVRTAKYIVAFSSPPASGSPVWASPPCYCFLAECRERRLSSIDLFCCTLGCLLFRVVFNKSIFCIFNLSFVLHFPEHPTLIALCSLIVLICH